MGVPKSHYDQLLSQLNEKTNQFKQLEVTFKKTRDDLESARVNSDK